MSDTATIDRSNKVTVTDAGPSRKKLTIEIPAETVADQLGSSLDTLAAEAELPGFRKGRVPRRLIEKKFGDSLRREAKGTLIAQAYSKAVEEHKLKVLADPPADALAKVEIAEGRPLTIELEVEVLPEFELPALDGIAVKKPLIDATDDMVNKELDRLLLTEGTLQPSPKPGHGDYLTGHAVMKDRDTGETYLDIRDAVIQVPVAGKDDGMILGVKIADFSRQLNSPEIGATITITTTGPDSHETLAVRGRPLVITFTPDRADSIVPAKAPEIAQRLGLEGVEQLKDALRTRLQTRVRLEQQSLMHGQIAKHLAEHTQMALPERLTEQQAARNLERRRMDLMLRGMEQQAIEEQMAELRASSAQVAVRELKLFFVLDKAAEHLGVKVSEAEVNGRIAQMAASRGGRPERLRQELISRNQIGLIFQQVREHKTMDAILARSTVEEMSIEDYNKFVALQSRDQTSGQKNEASADKPRAKSKKKSDE